ncbi:PEP-CTERM sorting domain-containing protein [Thalassomonas actiniarum]|uniref:PEP-CTERM sorting domain-containing protein n=1 Tax=Thalassomonas actiniarum TaxID=485447 RepID=A0AAF0C3E4_9GAMM|nr:PEP-CTERM sorting domain-containing protein [Thalassomonas actiniarum]WDD99487.1 PEP-CTERM sorting domain-containing protein [Thalassomonas actiniarum]
MKNIGLMKNMTAIALTSALSFGANATFMTATSNGGFVMKDAGEFINLDGTLHADQTNDGTVKHAGVRWGGDGAYSSLVLEDFAPDIDALDTNYMLSALTHNNFRISAAFPWLTNADILGMIAFTSTNTGGIAAGFGNSTVADAFTANAMSDFDIGFTETFNTSTVAGCEPVDEDGVAGGATHTFVTNCDDYFDFSIDNPAPLPDTLPFAIPFYIDGSHYALTIFSSFDVDGSTVLPPGRIWTEEEKSTTLYTFARLSEIPEPSTLAILALGLLGFSLTKRKSEQ